MVLGGVCGADGGLRVTCPHGDFAGQRMTRDRYDELGAFAVIVRSDLRPDLPDRLEARPRRRSCTRWRSTRPTPWASCTTRTSSGSWSCRARSGSSLRRHWPRGRGGGYARGSSGEKPTSQGHRSPGDLFRHALPFKQGVPLLSISITT